RAQLDIQLGFIERREHANAVPAIELAFSNQDDCAGALEIVHALRSSAKPSIFDSKMIMFRRGENYILRQNRGELEPLAAHLASVSRLHVMRVSIIISLMETLAAWSKVGVYLHSW